MKRPLSEIGGPLFVDRPDLTGRDDLARARRWALALKEIPSREARELVHELGALLGDQTTSTPALAAAMDQAEALVARLANEAEQDDARRRAEAARLDAEELEKKAAAIRVEEEQIAGVADAFARTFVAAMRLAPPIDVMAVLRET